MSYRTNNSYSRTQPSMPVHIKENIGELLQRFTPARGVVQAVKITDVQAVASYSWIAATTPTIVVPGSPNIWTNINPQRVPQDSGLVLIDQNSYRMDRLGSPLAPIFAAIDDLRGYDYSQLDFVSDRNSLRKLYRWSTGVAEDFRIDVELAGQTCLFTRREEKDSETIVGFKGFGRQYEKAATRAAPGCERTTSHHRIISINFGGLKVLLRFEVDGCTGETNADDLASALSNLGISSAAAATATEVTQRHAIPGVTVIRSNPRTLVAQSSLIELKTRAAHKPLDWADTYPQLYLSQTPHLYLAKHSRGIFTTAEKFNLAGSTLVSYAKQAEAGMGKLKVMLSEVLAEVKEAGNGVGLCLICVGGQLALYKRQEGTGKAVGKEILSRFI